MLSADALQVEQFRGDIIPDVMLANDMSSIH